LEPWTVVGVGEGKRARPHDDTDMMKARPWLTVTHRTSWRAWSTTLVARAEERRRALRAELDSPKSRRWPIAREQVVAPQCAMHMTTTVRVRVVND
jgi:hypothetical protein